jgi:hypothetical protein
MEAAMFEVIAKFLRESTTIENSLAVMLALLFGVVQIVTRL